MTDFGGKLRQARERRGVSLRHIADTTKISVASLDALERNDLSRLPGGIFSRAFVRSYALEVGLDPDGTVREFVERFQQESAERPALHLASSLAEEESALESRQRMTAVLVKIIVAGFVAAAVIFYLTWRQSSEVRRTQPTAGPLPTRGASLHHPWIPACARL
jgi:cytoskeleton protein RodZ